MLSGAPEGFDALVMSDIARARGGMTAFIARDGSRASAFADAMTFFAPELQVITFPAWDCLPYDRVGPSASVAADRMATLSRLARDGGSNAPAILVTTAAALVQRLPSRDVVRKAGYSAKVGATVEIADLERYFAVNGYQRASTVSEQGEFAVRGGVIDVFPPASEEPVRLDLFGDTLESIRGFDRETQRSTRQHPSVDLLPVSEALLDQTAIQTFRKGYLAAFGAPGEDPLIQHRQRRAVAAREWSTGCRSSTSSSSRCSTTCRQGALVAVDNLATEARNERLDVIHDAFDARETAERKTHYRALPPEQALPHGRGVGRADGAAADPAFQPIPGRARPRNCRPRREARAGVHRRAGPGQRQSVRSDRQPRPRARQGR